MVVPGKFTAFTKSTATGQKLKEGITHLHVKELCIHMDMGITGSNLKGKKLFIFTDSAEVEAQKVENKVTIEAGLPYIPTI